MVTAFVNTVDVANMHIQTCLCYKNVAVLPSVAVDCLVANLH